MIKTELFMQELETAGLDVEAVHAKGFYLSDQGVQRKEVLTPTELAIVEAVEVAHDPNAPDPNEYKKQREAEYPPIGDMIDAMAKALEGDSTEFTALQVQRNTVKGKYPKPA